MTPRATRSPHSGRIRTLLAAAFGALLALVLAAPSVSAALTSIATVPESPTTCDSVTLVVTGATPTPCYTIVRADLDGPVELPTMGPIPNYEMRVRLVLQETVAPDSGACPTVIQPYRQAFRLGRLRFGSYWVKAVEYLVPGGGNAPRDSSTLSSSFQVALTEGCPPPDTCYLLDFARNATDLRVGHCNASAPPGGTACTEIALVNGTPVQGVQTALVVHAPPVTRDPIPGDAIHAVSVEAVGRATGLLVQWTAEGSTTRIILVSTGDPIPAGRGAILRICYAIAPDLPPDVYPIRFGETIVADPEGKGLPPCPTFAEVFGLLCVTGPGCDLNGDGQGNILDVVQLVNCALARPDSIGACPESADCNGDGRIDVRDVICCVRKILDSGGFGNGDSGGAVGEPTRIGFTGPVRWLTPLLGRAELTVTPGAEFAGIDFGIDASSSGARIAAVRLVPGSGYRLESSVAADGSSARAMLFAMGEGSGTATIHLDLDPSLPSSGGGALMLLGAQSATRLAQAMPTNVEAASAPVPETAAPEAPSVMAPRPNPFRDGTEITYALPGAARATLRVYSASGRLVRTLVDTDMPAGVHRVRWDGRDPSGRIVGSGIYFFRFSADGVTRTERMLLLR